MRSCCSASDTVVSLSRHLVICTVLCALTTIRPPLDLGIKAREWMLYKLKGTILLSVMVVLKGLAEFAGLLLIGQGLVYALSFGKHESNAVYRMFRLATSPVVKVARKITPSQVDDRHVPFVALAIIFWIWFLMMETLYPNWSVFLALFLKDLFFPGSNPA